MNNTIYNLFEYSIRKIKEKTWRNEMYVDIEDRYTIKNVQKEFIFPLKRAM
ncbi:MAG: hypothetical protein LBT10_00330 [Methanobrevibacter sp.]|jgi:hypothetical protein|nr:hypothetical protein [Methanobrevibacter sp.]